MEFSTNSLCGFEGGLQDDLSGFKEMLAIIDAFQVVLIPD